MPLNISDFYMNSFLTTGRMYFFVFAYIRPMDGGEEGRAERKREIQTTFGGKLIARALLLSFGIRRRKLKNSHGCKIFQAVRKKIV